MLLHERGRQASSVAAVPHAQAAIVLGAFVQPNGFMSRELADRVQTALQLWRAGKVDRIIVSGDHHRWSYDEPDAPRALLLAAAAPITGDGRATLDAPARLAAWGT